MHVNFPEALFVLLSDRSRPVNLSPCIFHTLPLRPFLLPLDSPLAFLKRFSVGCVWQRIKVLPFADLSVPLCNGINIEDATIGTLQEYMIDGKLTSVDLVKCYLARIEQTNK